MASRLPSQPSAPPAGGDAAPDSGEARKKGVACPKCGTDIESSLADRDQWPWLPTQEKGILARHPWCWRCGRVKLVGAERAQDIGGLVNLVARLSRRLEEQGYKVTSAQRRLILRDLQRMEADDKFSLSRDAQLQMVCEVVGKYLYVNPRVIETYVLAP